MLHSIFLSLTRGGRLSGNNLLNHFVGRLNFLALKAGILFLPTLTCFYNIISDSVKCGYNPAKSVGRLSSEIISGDSNSCLGPHKA